MSVYADTARYYAELDREQAQDDAIERREADTTLDVYDWLKDHCGEDCAIALTDSTCSDIDALAAIHSARNELKSWVAREARRAIGGY